MDDNLKVVAFITGGGSTLCSIYRAIVAGMLGRVSLVGVIANTKYAAGIENVVKLGFPPEHTYVIPRKRVYTDDEYGDMLLTILRQHGADIIGLYGWLPKMPQNVVEKYHLRSINQHPGPLDPGYPDFGGQGMHGLYVHYARLRFARLVPGNWYTEATAQRVAGDYDLGAILRYEKVEILPEDTPHTLAARVLPVEHRLQIATLHSFAEGQICERRRYARLVPPGAISLLNLIKESARKKKFD